METLNNFLSNDMGYIQAMRYAQPLPVIAKPQQVPKKFPYLNLLLGLGLMAVVISVFVVIRKKFSDAEKDKKKTQW